MPRSGVVGCQSLHVPVLMVTTTTTSQHKPLPHVSLLHLLLHCRHPVHPRHPCHDTTKPLSLISILVNLILSWTPRGTMCLPRGTAQIALLSIGIYFLFSACLACDLRNRLPCIAIGLRP